MFNQINEKKIKKRTFFLLLIIILIQTAVIVYSFAFLKEDFHSDEQWSFGLSNSYYEPYIFQDADETGLSYTNQWVSPEIFHNYMTVQEDQRFNYKSVFYNQSKDLHPPLFYSVLHTICSFFPDRLSYWYGFAINIPVFIITQIFLFASVRKITKSDVSAIAGCILYGFSVGALNTYVFIRMYAMCTMWCTILAYLHIRMHKQEKIAGTLPLIFLTTLAGALTHHFFLSFAGCLSACFCFYYLFRKKFRKMFAYAITQISAAGMSVLIFPATINHLFGRRGEITKFSPSWQIRISFNLVTSELFGFHVSVFKSATLSIVLAVTVAVIILLLPLIYLFRNETWFKKLVSQLKIFIKKAFIKTKKAVKTADFSYIAVSLSGIFVIFTTAFLVSAITMNDTMDRYMFMIFPAMVIMIICILSNIINSINKLFSKKNLNSVIIVAASVLLCINANLNSEKKYLFCKGESSTVSIAETIKNSNCIYISREYWLMTCLADRFSNCNAVYPCDPSMIKENLADLSKVPDNESPCYLIANADIFKGDENEDENEEKVIINAIPLFNKADSLIPQVEFEEYVKSLPTFSDIELTGTDTVFGRLFYIYKLS